MPEIRHGTVEVQSCLIIEARNTASWIWNTWKTWWLGCIIKAEWISTLTTWHTSNYCSCKRRWGRSPRESARISTKNCRGYARPSNMRPSFALFVIIMWKKQRTSIVCPASISSTVSVLKSGCLRKRFVRSVNRRSRWRMKKNKGVPSEKAWMRN